MIYCGAVNPSAVPHMTPLAQEMYTYDAVPSFYENAPLILLPPLEPDGKHATYTEWLEGYERFLKAETQVESRSGLGAFFPRPIAAFP